MRGLAPNSLPGTSPYRLRRGKAPAAKPFLAGLAVAALLLAPLARSTWANRTELQPGINMFTPEQDIQLGKQNASQADKDLLILRDSRVENYLNNLGDKLAAHAPGYKYPYQFKCVNDMAVNAFALPGGYVFINRGVIEAAHDEAQLAGVMAHEISHVALRHGTNQATKAQLTSVPFAILGGMLGGNSIGGLLAQLGASFSLNSILLKYSRTDETQADVLGTQILYDSGYDPRAMAQFFEQLQAESKGKEPIQFFSSHPNPGNREERVDEEIDKLGGPPAHYVSDTPQFEQIKRYVHRLPPPPKSGQANGGSSAPGGKPEPPSTHFNNYQNDLLSLRYPDNWKANSSGSTFALLPEGGVVKGSNGQSALAYGIMFNSFQPQTNGGNITLEAATGQLTASLRKSNPDLRSLGESRRIQVGGLPAISGFYSNVSPGGSTERDWLVTFLRPEGVLFFICVAPENDFASYDSAFRTIIDSVRFRQ
jgi:Peptidase family M48